MHQFTFFILSSSQTDFFFFPFFFCFFLFANRACVSASIAPYCSRFLNHSYLKLDTAGQEKYALITSSQYKEAEGFFLCFDIADRASFTHVEKWIEQIEQYARKSVAMLLVGLKSDLDRNVTSEEAQEFATLHSLKYLEASSKTLANIDQVFLTMAQKAHEAAEAAAEDADE